MGTEIDTIRNALRKLAGDEVVSYSPPAESMFSFRYTYTEISTRGGQAHVRRSETRFEDGKLISEECEGRLDGDAYQRMVDQSQRYFRDQMVQAMRLFFLPFTSSGRDR